MRTWLVVSLLCTLAACGQPGEEGSDTKDVPEQEVQGTIDAGFELIAGDPDGDGFPTEVELKYGTDPNSAASHPPDHDGDFVPDPEDEDIDGDGVANNEDAFPYNAEESLDTDGDGVGNNTDTDDDDDGYPDAMESTYGSDPLDPTIGPPDLDDDGTPDDVDTDADGDGAANADDAFPEDPMEWLDSDGDGEGNNADDDDDNDGYSDDLELKYGTDAIDESSHPEDLDGDGLPDSEDLDMDGDGVDNTKDAFPTDAAESADSDGDGEGNNADADDDNDGYPDVLEEKYDSDPVAADSTPADLDGDLLPDEEDSDIDGDGVLNGDDDFPEDAAEDSDTDGDGEGDNSDDDDDGDGYPDALEEATGTNPKDADDYPGDLDGDGIPDEDDIDKDGDDVLNDADDFPLDGTEWSDFDGDGTGDNADEDDDGDGYPDDVEVDLGFNPKNSADHPADMDGDGTPDDQDDDIDGDGVGNDEDAFAYDPDEIADTDEDGVGDNGDKDDDNDGFTDEIEVLLETDPLDGESVPADQDGDLLPDAVDSDVDGDGVANELDAFPADPTETVDTDGDGQGDNSDTDDDDDGYSDEIEEAAGTDGKDSDVHPVDLDGDGIPDPSDGDVDGDGAANDEDAFPYDPDESVDTDDDGEGDNADTDDDGDGYPDDIEEDAGTDPKDPESHPDDLDGDGIADSADPDIDGDGVGNDDDAFPQDPDEWFDTDGDGLGNNGDLDDDGDGFSDEQELLFQTDPNSPFSFPADLDGDKIPDAIDPDRDGDGVLNAADAFPNNPAEWTDTDGDGVGNNVDLDDDGDGFSDVDEDMLGFDPLDFADHPGDLDGDGVPDISDPDMDGDGVANGLDAFPQNPVEWEDSDGDGLGDNTDLDDDGDGYADLMELDYLTDPFDPFSFPADLDGDFIPDLEDEDIDGDLVKNDLDAFPNDINEWFDTDSDGIGNNADLDDDGDGYLDVVELQYLSDPVDALSTPPDIDGDLIPDPEDSDKDGDGVPNIDDAFPEDPDAWEEIMDESSFGGDYQDTIPPDADPDTFDTKKFSLVRGEVWDQDGVAFEGATVTVLDHEEYGSVETDADGWYTIPVNGGLTLTLVAVYEGFSEVQRKVDVPWNDMIVVQPVELVPYDPVGSDVFMSGDENEVIVHTSVAAEHPITVAFTGDNLAVVEDEEGNLELTDYLTITATEYSNPDQMPGILPNTSEFTYCVDLKAEGYDHVEFDQPVMLWTKDFLDFKVGSIVPTGFYDRTDGKWKPMDDGVVVELLDLDGDSIIDALDSTGDGLADDLDNDGDFVDEVVGIDLEPDAMAGDIYWRVAVIHFSPIDKNWPASGPPEDAEPPPDVWDTVEELDEFYKKRKRCFGGGYSQIDVRGRILHETIPIPGTDFSLHYSSEWVPGYSMPITIPLSGISVPASLEEIIVNWSIAGRSYSEVRPPLPDQEVDYLWDGKDFMGNLVNQRITLSTEVGFKYPASYYSSPASAEAVGASFAAMGVEASGINSFRPVTLWRKSKRAIYRLMPEVAADAWSMGRGWSPDTYHYYDGSSQSVLMGDGRKLRGDQLGLAIDSVNPDSLPYSIRAIDVDSDGIIYFLPKGNPLVERQVMKLVPGKEPVVYVSMSNRIGDMSVGPDDNLYMTIGSYLWKVPRKTGNAVLMANLYLQFFNCFAYFGDYCLLNVDVDAFGYAFLVSRYPAAFGTSSMAIVAPDGTVLANPVDLQCTAFDMAVGGDGIMAAACKNGPVKKIGRDGSVENYPGWAPNCIEFFGYTDPSGIDILRDGSVLIADEKCNRVRKILPDGTVTTVAGQGDSGFSGDESAPLAALLNGPSDIAMGPDDVIYFADSGNSRVRKIEQVKSVVTLEEGQYGVPLATDEILIFGEKLEYLEVRDMTTGVVTRAFEHNDLGVLSKEIMSTGQEVQFEADAKGRIVTIIGVAGEETSLGYDQEGNLALIQYEDGTTYEFDYLNNGLLREKLDPGGNEYEYTYDETGRLLEASDPVGGFFELSQSIETSVIVSNSETAEGNKTSYQDVRDQDGNWTSTIIDPAGGTTTFADHQEDWEEEAVMPDGTLVVRRYGVDPKFETRFLSYQAETTPSGLSRVTQVSRAYDDQQGLVTHSTAINGKVTTREFDTLAGLVTTTTPEGRISSMNYDLDSGLTLSTEVPTLFPGEITYDDDGNPLEVKRGDRMSTMSYDQDGRISKITGAMGDEYEFQHDEVGRLLAVFRPDDSTLTYEYDANGLLLSITGADGKAHAYTRNPVEEVTQYEAPGGAQTKYQYDLDRSWVGTEFPSGDKATAQLDGGLLMKLVMAGELTSYTYLEDGSGRLGQVESPSAVVTQYSYDGHLKTQELVTGPVNGQMAFDYDDNFSLTSAGVAGTDVPFAYDGDGLRIGAGDLFMVRDQDTGAVSSISDGFVEVTYSYNGYGEVESTDWSFGGNSLYSVSLGRNLNARTTSRTEVVDGDATTREFGHDIMGQLTSVLEGGDIVESYTYDEMGNRLQAKSPALGPVAVSGTYADDYRLEQQGAWVFVHDDNGYLMERSLADGSQATTYEYAANGELRQVTLPDGSEVTWVYDGFGRAVVRKVDGVVSHKYLYYDQVRPAAVLNADDSVRSVFVYAAGFVPLYMQQGNDRFYLVTDDIGTVRMVVDGTGQIVQTIDYDSYGNVVYIEDPEFDVPFGFAGGMSDYDTGLVRFRFRDYDPLEGRWTAPEPLGPQEGFNPYLYVENDPVSLVDPLGLGKSDEVKEIVENNGVPGQIIPDNVVDYSYDKDSGKLNIKLDKGFDVELPEEAGGGKLQFKDSLSCTVEQGKLTNMKGITYNKSTKITGAEKVGDDTLRLHGKKWGFSGSKDIPIKDLPSLPPKKK